MDEMDWQIIDALLKDARTPFSEIGKKVGLGKGTIQRRVKKLQQEGVLGTPTIILDPQKCGFEGIIDFFIKTNSELEDRENILTQTAELAELPYIITVAKAIGDYNLYVSSFFRDFDGLRKIVELVKRSKVTQYFEIAIYLKDTSNPLMIPFMENRPEDSIIYKIRSKNTNNVQPHSSTNISKIKKRK